MSNPFVKPVRTILGYRKNGSPIYQIAGGAPTETEQRDYLSRLEAETDTHTAAIDEIVKRALAEERDLTDAEDEECKRHQESVEKLQPQLDRWAKLRETRTQLVTNREKRPTPPPAFKITERGNTTDQDGDAGETRVQRSAGHYVQDLYRASRGDLDSRERVQRALAKVLTSDVPGLLPVSYVGDFLGRLNGPRPLINGGATKVQLPESGMQFRRPRISAHTTVGVQTTEKTEVASSKFGVDFLPIDLKTYAGAVNVSIQAMERTDPAATNLIFEDLAAQYGIATEAAAATELTSAVTQSVDLAADATKEQILAAIFEASGLVYAGTSGEMPDVIVASVDQWSRLGALSYPINQQNGVVSGSPRTLSINVGDMPAIVSPQLPPGTLAVGRKQYLEIYENGDAPVQLRALEVGILGYEIGVYGLYAAKVTNANAWVKLAAPAAG